MLITLVFDLINEVDQLKPIPPKPSLFKPTAAVNRRQQQTSMMQASKTLRNPSAQNNIIKQETLNQRKAKPHTDLTIAQKKVTDLQHRYKISAPTVKF